MGEIRKTSRKAFYCELWMSPQFRDEKVLPFCSEKCKQEYIKAKLRRIKVEYPKDYAQLIKKTMCHPHF